MIRCHQPKQLKLQQWQVVLLLKNKFQNKISSKMASKTIIENVEKALDEISPFLKSDGEDITMVSIEDDKHVKVSLEAVCKYCKIKQTTLKTAVETTIKKYATEIETVENLNV